MRRVSLRVQWTFKKCGIRSGISSAVIWANYGTKRYPSGLCAGRLGIERCKQRGWSLLLRVLAPRLPASPIGACVTTVTGRRLACRPLCRPFPATASTWPYCCTPPNNSHTPFCRSRGTVAPRHREQSAQALETLARIGFRDC
jgi:hypothetical protein